MITIAIQEGSTVLDVITLNPSKSDPRDFSIEFLKETHENFLWKHTDPSWDSFQLIGNLFVEELPHLAMDSTDANVDDPAL